MQNFMKNYATKYDTLHEKESSKSKLKHHNLIKCIYDKQVALFLLNLLKPHCFINRSSSHILLLLSEKTKLTSFNLKSSRLPTTCKPSAIVKEGKDISQIHELFMSIKMGS